MRNFKITLIVPTSRVSAVLELIETEGSLVSVERAFSATTQEELIAITEGPNGREKRHHGTPIGRDLVLLALSKGPKTAAELVNVFVKNGRAPNSASPQISVLTHNGLIANNDGKYRLTAKGVRST